MVTLQEKIDPLPTTTDALDTLESINTRNDGGEDGACYLQWFADLLKCSLDGRSPKLSGLALQRINPIGYFLRIRARHFTQNLALAFLARKAIMNLSRELRRKNDLSSDYIRQEIILPLEKIAQAIAKDHHHFYAHDDKTRFLEEFAKSMREAIKKFQQPWVLKSQTQKSA
ncbi:hypothetical protein HYV44_01980 [Candidatus Microgenomates bacterium]|nr:hypothetical protein [Candidatus Microgenomates bacterium]